MLILDAGNQWQFSIKENIYRSNQWLNFPQVLLWGLSNFNSLTQIHAHVYDYVGVLYCSNYLLHKFFQCTFYTMNFGLIWDLYKSVRNPFENTEQRTRFIYLCSPIYFLGIFVYWGVHNYFNLQTFYELDPICGDFRFNLMMAPGNSIIQLLYNICAFTAVYIVGKALCRKGLNK